MMNYLFIQIFDVYVPFRFRTNISHIMVLTKNGVILATSSFACGFSSC